MVGVPDRTQIGPAVDAALWQRFRDDVKARKGQVRGVLGDELENAVREYLDDSPTAAEQEIIDRLARLERAAGISETDGGSYTSGAEPHTHAPSRLDSPDKPSANAATDKKVAYLANLITEEKSVVAGEPGMITREAITNIVKEEYGFRSDTAKRYVDRLVEHFGLKEHPDDDYPQLVTEPKYTEILEQDAAEQMETLDDSKP